MHQVNYQLARDKVVVELRRQILNGNLQPNTELYQDKIADELGVSRMPVREALQVLSIEGLVTISPNKVARVNEISEKFIHDHFSIRILLEKEAISKVCKKDFDPTELWKYYNRAEETIKRGDFEKFNDYDGSIHYMIWKAADNIKLEQLLLQLLNTINIENYTKESAELSNQDHKKIIEYIVNHDSKKAKAVIERHIDRSYERIKDQILQKK